MRGSGNLNHRGRRLDDRRDEAGAVVLMVVVMSTILFTIAALVVDLGQARVLRQEAQAASDSSALAAMNAMYLSGTPVANITGPGGAVEAAKEYAAANYGITDDDWASCDDPAPLSYQPLAGVTDCISFDDDTQPTTARVIAPLQTVQFTFSTVFGADEVSVSAGAHATLDLGGVSDCGLCLVGGGPHDLQNGDATISGGDVAINGDVNIQNNGLVSTDGDITVEGEATGPLDGYTPDPLTNQPPIDDPLANYELPAPPFDGLTARTNPCTDGPGIYGAFNFPNSTCTLQPGLYVVTGVWSFTGGAMLDATSGVTLYFACGTTTAVVPCAQPGQAGGALNDAGNGDVSITAPDSGPFQGLAIAYDRLNTSPINLSGNGSGTVIGTIYAYSANLRYDGNGCSLANQALIVVDSLEFNGDGSCLKSDYVHNKNVYVPPDGLHLSE